MFDKFIQSFNLTFKNFGILVLYYILSFVSVMIGAFVAIMFSGKYIMAGDIPVIGIIVFFFLCPVSWIYSDGSHSLFNLSPDQGKQG